MSPYQDPNTATRRRQQEDWNRQEAARAERMEYIKPAVMLAVGFLGALALGAMGSEDSALGALGSAIVFPFLLLIQIVAGVLGLLIVSVLWMGGAGALGLGILRMAGVCAIGNLALFLAFPLGPCIALIPVGMIFVGLIAWIFEMEMVDAIAVGVISYGLIVAATVALGMLFG